MILKFDECKECKKRTNDIYNCIRICDKPFEALEKFNRYKKLEEQGRLLKLPCAVGSEVWYIDKYSDLYIEIVRGVVDGYLWSRSCGFSLNIVWDKPMMGHFGYKRRPMPFSEIEKTVFLTRVEAEAALKKWRVNNGMVKKTDRRKS